MWNQNLSALQRDLACAERHFRDLEQDPGSDAREILAQGRLLVALQSQLVRMRCWAAGGQLVSS